MQNTIRPGILEIYCGPMKSGKTREIFNRVDKLKFMNSEFIMFKPSVDKRSRDVKSRFGNLSYKCVKIDENNPQLIIDYVKDIHKVIVIDEAHFFNTEILEVVKKLIADDKNIIIAGLDLDFRGEPFGMMPQLMSIADHIVKLTAVCDIPGCMNAATRTQRLIDGKPAPYDSPIVLVGDKTILKKPNQGYEARCLKHHIVPKNS